MKIPRIIDAMEHVDDKYILEASENAVKKKAFGRVMLAAVLAACVCLAAFSYTLFDSKEYLEDYDVDPNYMLPDTAFASAGDNYFGIIRTKRGYKVLNYDENTGETVPVCAVEGCDHTSGSVCTALQFPTYSGVSVYDGRVYWASLDKDDLDFISVKSTLFDGSDYQVHKRVPSEVLCDFNTQTYVRAHRGYMYFAGLINSGDGYRLRITAEELTEDGESFTVFEIPEGNVGYNWSMQIYANTIYIFVPKFEYDKDGNIVRDEDGNRVWTDVVYAYDINTRKIKELYSGHIPFYSDSCWFDKDGALFYAGYDGEKDCYTLCRLDTKTGKTETVFDISEISAEEYRYVDVLNGLVVAVKPWDDDVFVKRFDGSSAVLYFSDAANYLRDNYDYFGRRLAGADDKYVFFNCNDDENFLAVPLDGSEPKLMMSRPMADPEWEPYEY